MKPVLSIYLCCDVRVYQKFTPQQTAPVCLNTHHARTQWSLFVLDFWIKVMLLCYEGPRPFFTNYTYTKFTSLLTITLENFPCVCVCRNASRMEVHQDSSYQQAVPLSGRRSPPHMATLNSFGHILPVINMCPAEREVGEVQRLNTIASLWQTRSFIPGSEAFHAMPFRQSTLEVANG